jgi:bifunctional non-homologous end joining protein LigD
MPDKPPPDLDALLRYRQKRDFSRTPEPEAGAPSEAGDLTFVVQQHRATRMHWDFRLEVDGVLVSWAIPRGPSLNPKDKRMSAHVEDHPFDYGGFEGVIAKGNYGAGEVIVWDNGTYSPDEKGEFSWGDKAGGSARMKAEIEAGKVSFTLRGKKLRGSWTLVRIGGRSAPDSKDWLLIKHRDEYASTRDVLEDDKSVISGLTVKDLQEGRMPAMTPQAVSGAPHAAANEASFPAPFGPMLPTLIEGIFARPGWIFEPKMDGVRTLAYLQNGNVELKTRRGNSATVTYPEVVAALKEQRVTSAVFDGEIVATDENGVPDFQQIQARINLSRPKEIERIAAEIPVTYYVFDLLYLDGHDLMKVPLIERKTLLARTIAQGDHLRYIDHVRDDGPMMLEAGRGLGFEGVVAKRADSIYEPDTRSRSWLKIKDVNEQEFVVGGFTEGEGSRKKTFGGLLIGYYDVNDELRFASSVGSGLKDAQLAKIREQLDELVTDEPPFVNPPSVVGNRWRAGHAAVCRWVRPELVAQVKFASWTRDGGLRAPVFLGLRDDIDPKNVRREEPAAAAASIDVIIEEAKPAAVTTDHEIAASVVAQLDAAEKDNVTLEVGGASIKVTNLSKEFWPATADHPARTKGDLIRYYARVAPYLVPHLRDRPLTLTRYPNGIHGQSFYQKHWDQPLPRDFPVNRVTLWSSHTEGDQEYILVNNAQTLVWLAQLADLEMHASMARVSLDPDGHHLTTTFAGSEANLKQSALNYPDYMIFDLDPYIYAGTEKKGEEPALNRKAFEKAREIAFSLKDVLQQLRLSSFVKTTGKTGLHIYVPVLRQYTYTEIRAAAETLGRHMLALHPRDLTMEWAVGKRTGKIFFDHGQNTRGKTLAAQYSLRPSENAGVSAPVTWEELKTLYPTEFDMDTVPARLERIGDLWADILASKQDLRALIEVGGG